MPLTDFEIAVAGADGAARVWTDDADFQRIEKVLKELKRFRPH